MNYYTEEELKRNLQFNEREVTVPLPNSIFEMLATNEKLLEAKAPHTAVAYTYIFIVTWLYRFAKYGTLEHEECDVKAIKKILGYSSITKDLDYIVKKNGVLEQIGLIKTVSFKQAPISWHWDKENNVFDGFTTYDEEQSERFPEDIQWLKDRGIIETTIRNKKIKYPIFAVDDLEEEVYGTFWNPDNTHMIPFKVFLKCMTNEKLGCTAFMIYGYLHSRCGMNGGSIGVSIETISARTGIRESSRDRALDALKKYNLIKCHAEDFIVGKGDLETPANTYETVVNANLFNDEPQYYRNRTVMSLEQYEKHQEVIEAFNNSPL
ncbi:hypothetical protein ACFFHM_15615 [Halalkalibacter kiskunsagensis]|uniref:Replication protein n=1 Tax=Halalkalibacter kiskunsagensis TaxID=1548599 RepID=A0ABV6KF69_9BACI